MAQLTVAPVDADYVVRKPLTIDGVDYKGGEHLPARNALREMPHRLRILCDQGRLQLQVTPIGMPASTPEKEPESVPAADVPQPVQTTAPSKVSPDLDSWSLKRLQDECEKRGLSKYAANKGQLRDRLRAAMG